MSKKKKYKLDLLDLNYKNYFKSFFIGFVPISIMFWVYILQPAIKQVETMQTYSVEEKELLHSQIMGILIEGKVWFFIGIVLFIVAYIMICILLGFIALNLFVFFKKTGVDNE